MTMLSQVVAHELDIPLAHMHVVPPDTDTSPIAIGSLASRVTIAAGNAAIVRRAAARDKLLALAATRCWRCRPSELEMRRRHGASRSPSRSASCTLAELARTARLAPRRRRHPGQRHLGRRARRCTTTRSTATSRRPIRSPPRRSKSRSTPRPARSRWSTASSPTTAARRCNPLAIHGQTNGATVQAIGWALYEQLQLDGGRMANGNFADYTMATGRRGADAARRHRRIERSERALRRQGRERDRHPARRAGDRQRGLRRRRRAHHATCRSRPRRCWPACAHTAKENAPCVISTSCSRPRSPRPAACWPTWATTAA